LPKHFEEPDMTRVKICGLSTPETMRAALDAGADFVGLVFFAKSPRNVSIETAIALADIARGHAEVVTLTVDADDDLLRTIASEVRPDFIQAHGHESPERVRAIKDLTDIQVIKAAAVATQADVAATSVYDGVVDLMLYDAKPPPGAALPGGNGVAFDWTILKDAPTPYMLAGGLTPDNVAQAIAVTKAQIVDVSSGVESAPGVKDVTLIRKFIEAAKANG
jgi:phosphoribosylanthranilate isomerase